MKNRTIKYVGVVIASCGISTLAYAVGAGLYMGAQGGMSNVRNRTLDVMTNTTPPIVSASPSNTGFGGRFFLGGNYNENVAMEFGFTHYAPSTYSPEPSALCGNPQIKQSSLDVLGKGIIPVSNFDVYGKLGVAYIRQTASGSLSSTEIGPCGSNSSNSAVRPAAALGVSYDLNQNWVADLSYNAIISGGGTVPSASLVAVGISYHFVDKYCGQFLC